MKKLAYLSLWEPWATIIAKGLKNYETRPRKTNYRGLLVICASLNRSGRENLSLLKKQFPEQFSDFPDFDDLPFGKAVCLANLSKGQPMTSNFDSEIFISISNQTPLELATGNWKVGRYAFKLENILPLPPFPIKGKQSVPFYDVPYETESKIIDFAKSKGVYS